MKDKGIYFVEYSKEQDCFHVDTAQNILKINNEWAAGKRNDNDYKVVCVCSTREECQKFIDLVKETKVYFDV